MKNSPFRLWTIAVALSACFAARDVEAAVGPGITIQPQSQTNFFGSNVVFTVTASGQTPLFYHWSFNGTNLTNSTHISGATTTALTINNIATNDAGNYRVVVTNSHGSVTSAVATLKVLVPAAIVASPTNQSVVLSNNASFAAAVVGTAPLDYQWYFNGAPLTDGNGVTGSTTTDLNISGVQPNDAGSYQLVVTNNYGMVTSAVAALTVLIPANITDEPTNQTVLLNSNAVLTAMASGTAPLNYQWYFNGALLADGNGVTGSTTANLNLSNVQTNEAGSYQLVVTNNYGSATSAVAVLTVLGPPVITSQPVSVSAVENRSAGFFVTAMGAPPLSYEWYFNGSPLFAFPNFTYVQVQPSYAGSYFAIITNAYGAVTSDVVTLTVLIPPQITTQPQAPTQPLRAGATVALSVAASGTTPFNYQWYFNDAPLSDAGRVSGSTTANLKISNSQTNDSGNYFVVVGNTAGTVTSSNAIVSVLEPPSVTLQPMDQTLLQGSNVTFSATVSGAAPLSYQWVFNGNPLTDGGQISGAATTNLTVSNLQFTNGGTYILVATNLVGSTTSWAAVLTVLSPPSFTQQPLSSQNIVQGSNAVFSTSVIGTAPFSFQWYFDGNPLTDDGRVSGSMTSVLSVANAQTNDSGLYQLIVTNNYGSATSIVSSLTVQLPVSILGQPTNRTVLAGSSVSFTVSATGFVPPNYLWYSNGIAMANGGRISGATSANLTISNAQTNDSGTTYQVVVTNIYGSATSSVATLTVLSPAQITSQPASQAVLLGSNASFAIAAAGSPPLNYQWYLNGTPLTDNGRISGSATPVLIVSNVQPGDAGGYAAVVTNQLSSARSLTASLTPQTVLAPSTRYVALTSTNPLPPYLDWTTAATNIQDAIDATVAGDLVLVSNGTYNSGGRVVYGTTTNRVAVNKAITVQSVNGPSLTLIGGSAGSPAGRQVPFIRCVYLTNGAALIGFTVTNGSAGVSGDAVLNESGGGVWCESSGAVISNCVLNGNSAVTYGGGVFQGTLFNCFLTNNSGGFGGGACSNLLISCTLTHNFANKQNLSSGGGAAYCTLSNCLVTGNICNEGVGGGTYFSTLMSCVVSNNGTTSRSGGGAAFGTASNCLISGNNASNGGGVFSNVAINCILQNNLALNGGGAYNSTLVNCTIASNTAVAIGAVPRGGGVYGCSSFNSIIYDNVTSGSGSNYYFPSNGIMNYCCTWPLPANGVGNITNDPVFLNLSAKDFHLQSNSPCINSGNNAYVTNSTDFDGNPRIAGGTVDIGAYEYQTPISVISYAWLQQYSLPTDGSVDYADLDGTSFNVYQDWVAGLNPLDPTSVLAMQTPLASANFVGLLVSWSSVSNRTYYLQRASDLTTQPAFSTIQSNIAGRTGTTIFQDAAATNSGPYFYRVGVQ